MSEIPIDLKSSHHVEDDGSHTVLVTVSGLPSVQLANEVSNWMRDAIRANAHKIGRLDTKRNEQ